MKPLKAAAVVAGSMIIAGAAAPAFADDLTPTSLNGGLDTIAGQTQNLDAAPLATNALDADNKDSVLNAVGGISKSLHAGGGAGKLLGGLPLGK
jgi:hypothetical protein